MHANPHLCWRFFTACLLAVTLTTHAAEPTLIVASDLLKLKQIDSPALSPDGRWVAYVLRSIEPKPASPDDWTYQTHLWLAATDGATPPRQLTFGTANDSDPRWSPQGDRIAFVRSVEKEKPQLRLLPLAGGESAPLTKIETGASRPRWSPDGNRLLFTSSLDYNQVRAALEKSGTEARPKWSLERPGRATNDTKNYAPKKKGGEAAPKAAPEPAQAISLLMDGTLQERREWLAKNETDGEPRPLVRLDFLDERDIDPELSFAHLFVIEAREGATPGDLTPGYTSFTGGEWMADGKSIVGTGPQKPDEHPDRSEFSRLYRIDAGGGGVTVFAELKDYSIANPRPSPDGRYVALTATHGGNFSYAQTVVAIVPVTGGRPQLLTEKLDRNAGNLHWSADSTALTFVAPTSGAFPLYQVSVPTGATARLTPRADVGVRAYDLARDVLVQVLTTPANPGELHVGRPGSPATKPLTRHNTAWLAGKKLSAYEEHSLTNSTGNAVQFWTMKPTAFEPAKKYPLLLQIHGGPAAMWGPGEDSMWFEFQYFAARGYALVFSNPRGSSGYGFAFQRANYQDWGTGPAADILAAADVASRQAHVDPRRQVITGGSYGGYMVAWIVGHDPRFAAAVAQRGVYDLVTFFGEGNAWRLVPRAFGGYPWQPETRRILERESPLAYVESIKTPLLIQHGDNDRRTGFVQSEMLLRSLKQLGRDVESVRYPRASHEMSRSGEPRQRLDSLVRYEEFFRRYLGEH
jgi:dipeptidyl aminopeptidase/acylaminoacyl peptidase